MIVGGPEDLQVELVALIARRNARHSPD
jgi:hypothetical protein